MDDHNAESSPEKNPERLTNLVSSAYLQRSINSTYSTILQDQVNAKNQRLSLMTKQLDAIAKL